MEGALHNVPDTDTGAAALPSWKCVHVHHMAEGCRPRRMLLCSGL